MDWIVYHKDTPDFQEADGGFVTMTDFTKVADVRFVTASDGDRSTLFRITNSVDEYWVEEFCNEKYHESRVFSFGQQDESLGTSFDQTKYLTFF